MRLRVINVPRRGEVTVPAPGDLHGEINTVLSRSPRVFAQAGVDVYKHPATSPHTPDGKHDVYWLNEPHPDTSIAWDNNSVQRVFEKKAFWESYEPFLRDQQSVMGDSARAYMYWGFHLPGNEFPEFPIVWRGLQSHLRLHSHVAESVEHDAADDWLDSADQKHIGHIARFLNLAGERAQEEVLKDRGFGERFHYEQEVYGNDQHESVKRTLFAFPSLHEAIQASKELKEQIIFDWLVLSVAISQSGPAVFSGQSFNVLQSSVPNFVFILPSKNDSERLKRSPNEVWVAPFSVAGAPEILTPGGIHLERR